VLPVNLQPNAHDTGHAAHTGVQTGDQPELRQSLDNPLRTESQLNVATDALPPAALFLFVKQIVNGDTIVAVLKKACQNSIVVTADGDKSIIPLQGSGNIVAKGGGKYTAWLQSAGGGIQKRIDRQKVR
jgi:hypothetical protein